MIYRIKRSYNEAFGDTASQTANTTQSPYNIPPTVWNNGVAVSSKTAITTTLTGPFQSTGIGLVVSSLAPNPNGSIWIEFFATVFNNTANDGVGLAIHVRTSTSTVPAANTSLNTANDFNASPYWTATSATANAICSVAGGEVLSLGGGTAAVLNPNNGFGGTNIGSLGSSFVIVLGYSAVTGGTAGLNTSTWGTTLAAVHI